MSCMNSLKVIVAMVTLVPKINYEQLHILLMNEPPTQGEKMQVEMKKSV